MADDWVESRQRSYQGVKTAMSGGAPDSLSRGAVEVRDRLAVDFHHTHRHGCERPWRFHCHRAVFAQVTH
ncbi:hypothetical protein [Streptomyces microflavus]|uniref:hypothetical protein n=1 Tax=Streptomyces microflavus TaxID=1919 RepID=UPI0033BCEDF9